MSTTTQSAAEAPVCAVCLEPGGPLLSLKCGHQFHNACIVNWLESCPLCRAPINAIRIENRDKNLIPYTTEQKKQFKTVFMQYTMLSASMDNDTESRNAIMLNASTTLNMIDVDQRFIVISTNQETQRYELEATLAFTCMMLFGADSIIIDSAVKRADVAEMQRKLRSGRTRVVITNRFTTMVATGALSARTQVFYVTNLLFSMAELERRFEADVHR